MIDIIVNVVNFLAGLFHVSPAILAGIFGVLFSVSEGLAFLPFVKSNSIFQLVFNVLKKLAGK